MSEYWKSTPKYWCKHCKTFVRDTKLEKANHEATPKHQGNIKRFLRDLHRGNERDLREKQRAKDEVNRLNGVVSGSSGAAGPGPSQEPHSVGAPWRRRPIFHPPTNDTRQATPAERRQQLAQLAEMGIAVPEEFRRDMAMAGDWQVVSETPLYESGVKKEEDDDEERSNEERKYAEGLNIGVRKRKYDGQEEEEEDEAGEMGHRKGWGSKLHTYPNPRGEEDLDSLLWKSKLAHIRDQHSKDDNKAHRPGSPPPVDRAPPIKREDTDETKPLLPSSSSSLGNSLNHNLKFKEDPDGPDEQPGGIVFKKRKAKPIRNK